MPIWNYGIKMAIFSTSEHVKFGMSGPYKLFTDAVVVVVVVVAFVISAVAAIDDGLVVAHADSIEYSIHGSLFRCSR